MSATFLSADGRREWAACGAMLMLPARRVRAQGSAWLHWMLIGLVLLAGCAALMAKGKMALMLLAVVAGIPLTLLVLMWWVLLFSSMLEQYSATAMHLLPRMRQRAMRASAAAWLVAILLMTLCVGVPTGYPGQVAVLTGLALLEITVMFNRWRIGLFVFALWIRAYAGVPIPDGLVAFLGSYGAVAIGALLVVLDGRAALHRMFGTADGARPWKVSKPAAAPWSTRLARLLKTRPRDLVRRQPAFTKVLGAPVFAGAPALLAVPALGCVAIRAVVALQDIGAAHDRLLMTRSLALVGVLILQALMVQSAATCMLQHRSEQTLVRLAPATPPAGALNRVLARYLLANFALMWIGCTAVAIACLLVLGASAGEALRALAACTLSLALAGLPLRDYARSKAPHFIATLLYWLCAAAALVVAVVAVRGKFGGQSWAALAIAGVLLAALFVCWRWRAMVAAPPAFPAGRNR
ncbi:MAG: hypothetical protein QFF03_22725 [Pseudomonadota bacterium]|nr:hypothetical protein [Pseudomonadota bacterium]